MTSPLSTPELAECINEHLGPKLLEINRSWKILDSPLSGRGVFAARDISPGEVILRDVALLAGPKVSDATNLNTCIVCCTQLQGQDEEIMCTKGCTMPICSKCSDSQRHSKECELLRHWKPKDTKKLNFHCIRIISLVRCFFLGELQRKLLFTLQSNTDKFYRAELIEAANCFENFPRERDMLEHFYRTICIFNTNSFEGNCRVDGNEVGLRALFPLASLINHQCTPNASHHFENTETIVITATRPIRQGEEIVISYTKLLWGNLTRKMFLFMTKHFMCSCQRCLDPTVSCKSRDDSIHFESINKND